MRILIIGIGVIGSIYGHILSKSGNDVYHYVRDSKRAKKRNSIRLNLIDERKGREEREIEYNPKFIFEFDETDRFNLIIVSLRHYQVKDILPQLSVNRGDALVIFLNHIWMDHSEIEKYITKKDFVCGFPCAGGGYNDSRAVLNGAIMNYIYLEAIKRGDDRKEALIRVFKNANIGVKKINDMESWLWKQFALNAGLSSIALESGGTDKILSDLGKIKSGVLYIREALNINKARGGRINFLDAKVFFLPPTIAALLLKMTLKVNRAQLEIFKYYNNFEEVVRVQKDLISKANELNVNTPLIKSTYEKWSE